MVDTTSARLHLQLALGFRARLFGLHARPRLSAQQGLWLNPCRAVHTFGLAYEIDVVFLDASLQALKVESNLQPGRIAFCLRASSVVELPGGYCARNPHYSNAITQALVESNSRVLRQFPS